MTYIHVYVQLSSLARAPSQGYRFQCRRSRSSPTSPARSPEGQVPAAGVQRSLRWFVELEGRPVSEPDGNGYYPLQWAALNNYPYVAQYIIDVNCFDLGGFLRWKIESICLVWWWWLFLGEAADVRLAGTVCVCDVNFRTWCWFALS